MSCVTVTYYCTVLHCGFSPRIRLRIERKIRCLKWKNILQDKNHSNWLKTNSSEAKIFRPHICIIFSCILFLPFAEGLSPLWLCLSILEYPRHHTLLNELEFHLSALSFFTKANGYCPRDPLFRVDWLYCLIQTCIKLLLYANAVHD